MESKIKNVRLVTTHDEGYIQNKAFFKRMKCASRPVDYSPKEQSALYRVSRDVEYEVRKWYGSDYCRVICYDELVDDGRWITRYRELDGVKLKDNDSILIFEIKSSAIISRIKGMGQLLKSKSLLMSIFKSVEIITINVSMQNNARISDFKPNPLDVIPSKLGTVNECLSIVLTANDIRNLTRNNVRFNHQLFDEACIEGMQVVENRKKSEERRYQNNLVRLNQTSEFGTLLQNALNRKIAQLV